MDDQTNLEQSTLVGIIRDLESLGVVITSDMAQAIKGRLAVNMALSFQQGWRAALLRVMADLNKKHPSPQPTI